MKVTLWAWSQAKGFNRVAKRALLSLGYRVTVKPVGAAKYWDTVGDSRNRAQIGFTGWWASYSPAEFLVQQLGCRAFLPGSLMNMNVSGFCDPGIDRQTRRAQAEQLSDPAGSRALWQRADREVTDASPWVPLMIGKNVGVLSKRVGNYQYSPAMGTLIDQLCVR